MGGINVLIVCIKVFPVSRNIWTVNGIEIVVENCSLQQIS